MVQMWELESFHVLDTKMFSSERNNIFNRVLFSGLACDPIYDWHPGSITCQTFYYQTATLLNRSSESKSSHGLNESIVLSDNICLMAFEIFNLNCVRKIFCCY